MGASMLGAAPQTKPPEKAPPEFQPVDQGIADTSRLSSSYRDMGIDLRAPVNFERLYKVDARSRLLKNVPGASGWRGGAYARAHGGIVAVFPQSAYRNVGKDLELIEVPPGTIFTLADSSRMTHVETDDSLDSTRPSTRLYGKPIVNRIEEPTASREPAMFPTQARHINSDEPTTLSIWTDEDFRQRRVANLLDRALTARTAPSPE